MLPKASALVVAAAGLTQLLLLGSVFLRRMTFPLDLEWEEGGMLCHAQRLLDGSSLYQPPSVEFIPFLYTPLYPAFLALLGKLTGISYGLARGVSVFCFCIALALLVDLSRRSFRQPWVGLCWGLGAAGLVAAAFPHSAAWYDLARNDSLFLCLVMFNLYALLLHYARTGWLIAAGVSIGLAFLTKQTASIFVLYTGAALLLMNWRKLPVYVASVGLVAGGTTLWLNHRTQGWFWRVIFELHQGHDFYRDRLWPQSELYLFKASPVACGVLAGWLLWRTVAALSARRLTVGGSSLGWAAAALVGVAASAVGYATQWAAENAFIPGFFFLAAFLPIAAADLSRSHATSRIGALCRRLVLLLLALLLAGQLLMQLYPASRHVPSEDDRLAARHWQRTLATLPRPTLIPYHPWYARLAGSRCHYHQMGINDFYRAGYPLPADLQQRIAAKHYRSVVFDNAPDQRYAFLLRHYKLERFIEAGEAPRVLAGYQVRPTYLLKPKSNRPDRLAPGARRVFGFERGDYQGWRRKGHAFANGPIGGQGSRQILAGPYEGSYLAGSYFGGDQQVGLLRSPSFVVDRPLLAYRIGGGRQPEQLMVRLLVAGREVHRATGENSHRMRVVTVDVSRYLGQPMQVELVDNYRGAWGHLLFDDLQLRPQ